MALTVFSGSTDPVTGKKSSQGYTVGGKTFYSKKLAEKYSTQQDTGTKSKPQSITPTTGDTLTVLKVDPNTGKTTVIKKGKSSGETGLPSVTGKGELQKITPESAEKILGKGTTDPQKITSMTGRLIRSEQTIGGVQTVTPEKQWFESKVINKFNSTPQQESAAVKYQRILQQTNTGAVYSPSVKQPVMPGQPGYYDPLPSYTPRQPSTYIAPTIQAYIPKVDISKEEYEKRVAQIKKEIDKEAGMYAAVGRESKPNVQELFQTYQNIPKNQTNLSQISEEARTSLFKSGKSPLTIESLDTSYQDAFYNYPKSAVKAGYEFLTGSTGYIISQISPTGLEQAQLEKTSLFRAQREGLLTPYKSALSIAEESKSRIIEERLGGYYFGKQAVESAGFIIGGPAATVSTIGAISRASNWGEVAVPFALGVGSRILAPFVGAKLSSGVTTVNKKLQEYSSKFLPKVPVPKDMIVPNTFPPLTESTVAKSIIIGGAAAETLGIQFVPLDYKQEYIRQVGLFNAVTPIGYKAQDTGMMLAKYGGLRAIDVATTGADILGVKYKGKSTKLFDAYAYKEFAGTETTDTPIFSKSERELMNALQDTDSPGVGAVYKKYGLDPKKLGTFSALRSGKGKLADIVEDPLVYYEGTKFKFASPTTNPIALRQSGLKARLFGERPGLYSDYELGLQPSNLQYITSKQVMPLELKKGLPFTEEMNVKFKEFYGYSKGGLDKYFSKTLTIEGTEIPAGKPYKTFDYERIIAGKGKFNRPLKSREIINLIGEQNWEKIFIDMDSPKVFPKGTFTSTPSRALGATKEAEVAIRGPSIRVQPLTPAKQLARKLGFADAYVWYDFEAIPLNYEVAVESLLPAVVKTRPSQQGTFGVNQPDIYRGPKAKQGLFGVNQPTTFKSSKVKPLLLGSEQPILVKQKTITPNITASVGGYSAELKQVFGKSPAFSVLKAPPALVLPKIDKQYRPKYTASYEPVYLPKYEPTYAPKYFPSYEPTYTPEYVASYEPSYVPKYTPDYTPTYTPSYTPNYIPSYTPTYTPEYTPTYNPKYTPKYPPLYTPKYTPQYPPKYNIPYPPKYPTKYPIKYYTPFDEKDKRKKGKGFLTFIRKEGKTIRLTKTPLSYGLALKLGKQATRKGLSQSFFVKQYGVTKFEDIPTPSLAEYRQKKPGSRIKEQVFIEKNPLATKRETGLLQQAKKSSRSLFG